jgi:hypothetical protein
MKFNFIEKGEVKVAEILNEKHEIKSGQDGLDIVGNSIYGGAYKIMLYEEGFAPEFFDLKSGLAGEILQKFSNYNCEVVIIGEFSKYTSQALQDFIFESNSKGKVSFVDSKEKAELILFG